MSITKLRTNCSCISMSRWRLPWKSYLSYLSQREDSMDKYVEDSRQNYSNFPLLSWFGRPLARDNGAGPFTNRRASMNRVGASAMIHNRLDVDNTFSPTPTPMWCISACFFSKTVQDAGDTHEKENSPPKWEPCLVMRIRKGKGAHVCVAIPSALSQGWDRSHLHVQSGCGCGLVRIVKPFFLA